MINTNSVVLYTEPLLHVIMAYEILHITYTSHFLSIKRFKFVIYMNCINPNEFCLMFPT